MQKKLGFFKVLAVVTVACSAQAHAATYLATVTPSYNPGMTFVDCFRFADDGSLTVDGLSHPLTYAEQALDTEAGTFQAVMQPSAESVDFSIMFWGKTSGKKQTTAQGVNNQGTTFTMTLQKTKSCSGASVSAHPNGWRATAAQ